MKVPAELRDWFRLLARHGVMGSTEHEVAVNVLRKGLHDMISGDYIRNFLEQRAMLRIKCVPKASKR